MSVSCSTSSTAGSPNALNYRFACGPGVRRNAVSLVDPAKALPLISFETIMQEPLPPVEWLVEGLIADGDRVMLYGEFGSFKSWVLPSLALHIAAGRPWLGKFTIPQSKCVLYLDEEMHPRTLRRRIQRLARGMGLSSDQLPLQTLSRFGIRFDALGVTRLLSGLTESGFDPEVVIVETFRRVLRGNENEASDVAEFWRCLRPLAKGRTVIISHHMRKRSMMSSSNSRERASGSTDILAGADAALAIQRTSADALVVECVKLREAEEPEPFVVSLYDESQDGPVELRFEGARAQFDAEGDETERATRAIEMFLRASQGQAVDRGAILGHLTGRGTSLRTGERALSRMKKTGRLQRPGRGFYQLASPPHAS
jgi:AAA domain-containing protein